MKWPRRTNSPAAGFTLIELLVAMALTALVLLVFNGALHFGARAWESGQNAADAAMRVRLVQAFLRRQINAAALNPVAKTGVEEAARLEGGPSRFVFSGLFPSQQNFAGYQKFSLYLRDDNLILAWRPYLANDSEAGREKVLLTKVENLQFAYAETAGAGNEIEWLENWQEDGRLPVLVKISLEFLEDERGHWPEFVAIVYNATLQRK